MLTQPDKGWAWVVMFASLGANVVHGGFLYSVGILHIAFLERFNENITKTSWVGAIFLCLFNATSLVSGILLDRFGCRVTMMAGSLVMCGGLLCSAYLPSLELIMLSFGVITGIGAGLSYSASMVVVGLNFHENRNLAFGVSVSGIGIGTTALAPLLQLSRDMYGYTGLFFICAGLALQHCIFGALYFPSYMEVEKRRVLQENEDNSLIVTKVLAYFGTLQNTGLVVFSSSMFFSHVGIYLVYVHFPEYVVSTGHTAASAAYLIALSGVCGTVSRVLSGLFSNVKNIDDIVIYSGSMGVLGLSVMLFPVYSGSQAGLIVFSVLLGIYYGGFVPVLGSILVELAGVTSLAASFGMIFFTTGIGVLIGPPLGGFIIDSGGRYETSFLVSGCFIVLGAVMGATTACFQQRPSYLQVSTDKTTDVEMLQ